MSVWEGKFLTWLPRTQWHFYIGRASPGISCFWQEYLSFTTTSSCNIICFSMVIGHSELCLRFLKLLLLRRQQGKTNIGHVIGPNCVVSKQVCTNVSNVTVTYITVIHVFGISKVGPDKVRMYEEEIMTNDDNLESSLPTSSLLKCGLWYKVNCVFTAQW